MKRISWRVALAGVFLLTNGCVQIYVNEERFHSPNVVRGMAFLNDEALAIENERLLKGPFPNRSEARKGDAGDERPHPGRLYDATIEPGRIPAPGKDSPTDARFRFEKEWRFNRLAAANEPPRLCVAMSGGGIRSASFNIGVLSALHEKGLLGKVDVLSAVSGGAYALSWYYAQHHIDALHGRTDAKDLDTKLFAPGGAHQRFLQTNSSIFGPLSYYAIAAFNLAMTPLNFLVNGVFGWHMNTTPGRSIYESRLQETYQSDPLGAHLDRSHSSILGGRSNRGACPTSSSTRRP